MATVGIIASYREHKKDNSYPQILINSINMTKMLDLIAADRLEEVTGYLVDEVGKLADAGADFGLLASNTPHLVFDDIQGRSPIPLISIVEKTCLAAKKSGYTRLGLFGTAFTMKSAFYENVFSRQQITIVVPDTADQDYIHEKVAENCEPAKARTRHTGIDIGGNGTAADFSRRR